MKKTMTECPLCESPTTDIFFSSDRDFFKCHRCELIFLDPTATLDPADEKSRYLEHENHILTEGYKKFLYQVINPIKKLVQSPACCVLDYGSGPYPMMQELLLAEGINCSIYDPFFAPQLSDRRFDIISLCEVAEHFHSPKQEFLKLNQLLKPGGHLVIQTSLFTKGMDFSGWHYKNDPTHCSFYSESCFENFENLFELKLRERSDNVIVLQKKI